MKDFSAELMLARHSSIMNWGTLCLAYLKDFGIDRCIEEDIDPVLVHHELGHAVLAYLKDFSVDGCIQRTLAQYLSIMN